MVVRIRHKDGGYRYLESSAVPNISAEGKLIGFRGVDRDVTERKRADDEIRALNAELEQRVAQRTKDLAVALDVAERANHAKREFLANMSHEIRTPLNAVLGIARIGQRDSQQAEARKNFHRIVESGQHLLDVINDILDFSKMEAGMLSINAEPFRLLPAMEDAVGIVTERALDKGLRLRLNVTKTLPTWVDGDKLRLRQILFNLLSNAIKFTDSGAVSLSVDSQGEMLRFQVTDSGIGITDEQLSHLFHPFEQADSSTTRRYGGTGLGLAISRNLAGLMGGSIQVESRIGVGSSFSLLLPLAASSPRAEGDRETGEQSEGPQLSGLRVLAAEDVEINRLILEDLLEREGARVVFAEDGQQALDRLQELGADNFDLVLMDVQMPVMDGHEATNHILDMAPQLPVIGLTTHALNEERDKCLKSGMVDHVPKPIVAGTLIASIRKHANKSDLVDSQ